MDTKNSSDEKINQLVENYKASKNNYARFAKAISQLLKQLLDSSSIRFQQVTFREKERRKNKRKEKTRKK